MLETGEATVLTEILQDVVQSGTGRRASISGRSVAGKTGTTDNYADAWFVGYTPELVVAVWVGYPDRLRPMLTEFGGEPVTGGTLPAEIWREFVRKVDDSEDESFDYPPYLGAVPTYVVRRGGEWRLDNGHCRGSHLLVYFSGEGPERTANCKPNEVQVPMVVGMTEEAAIARLAAQPLEAELVAVPAKPGRAPSIVLNQEPKAGGLSAGDSVRLYVSKAEHGLVPNFVGSSLADASKEVRRLKLRIRVVNAPGPMGVVLKQTPVPGVTPRRSSASGSWSGTAHVRGTPERVAPGQVGGPGDADAGADDDVGAARRRGGARTAARSSESPSCRAVDRRAPG